ncbi:MAG: hypothetical protein ABSB70_21720 [Candidatus Velthaea sp.]
MIRAFSPIPAGLIFAAACTLPLAAGAQTPSYASRSETIRGTISSVESVDHLLVADDRGYTDDVTLRRGAAVSGSGVRLVPGERVTIQGAAAGSTFLATRIATHGQSYAGDASAPQTAYPVPVPAYYPAPVYYPAPYYSASLYFGFGPYYRYGYGRWFRPYYGYRGGYGPVRVRVRFR